VQTTAYGNANVAAYLPTYTGNISAGNVFTGGVVSATGNIRGANLNTAGLISATGNVTGNFIIGDGSQLTNLPSGTGDITFVNTTISAPNNDDITIQALSNDSLPSSDILLSPSDTLTRLTQCSQRSNQRSQSFTTANSTQGHRRIY
jgi:hypothetical protein